MSNTTDLNNLNNLNQLGLQNVVEPTIDLIDLSVNDPVYYYERALRNKHNINVYFANLTQSAYLNYDKAIKLLCEEYEKGNDKNQIFNKNLVDYYKYSSINNNHWSINYLGVIINNEDIEVEEFEQIPIDEQELLSKKLYKTSMNLSNFMNNYAIHNLCTTYYDNNKIKKYKQLSKKHIETNCVECLHGLAGIYYESNKIKKCKQLYKKHIMETNCDYCINELGCLYIKLNKIPKAIQLFQKGIENNNKNCMFSLANIYNMEEYKDYQNYSEALRLYTQYYVTNSNNLIDNNHDDEDEDDNKKAFNNILLLCINQNINIDDYLFVILLFAQNSMYEQIDSILCANFNIFKTMSIDNIRLIVNTNCSFGLFANNLLSKTKDFDTYKKIINVIIEHNNPTEIYTVLNFILIRVDYNILTTTYTEEILDAIRTLDISKVSIDVSNYFKICQKLLNQHTNVMDLHFKYSVNGKGFNDAKNDFYNLLQI